MNEISDASQTAIVAVGASAGGLEAMEAMFHEMPCDTGMSFVIVQHLSPHFESHMDQLLGRVTPMPIEVVQDGVKVQPNTIYLIPPGSEVVMRDRHLHLHDRSPDVTLSLPIDRFFTSLAIDVKSAAIGVVLSGTGSDGSRGVSQIAAAGGLVIAQTADSCRFDSMPVQATQTGCVHLNLPPAAIGEALVQYCTEHKSPAEMRTNQFMPLKQSNLESIFALLQHQHDIDFSRYKSGTINRRIDRRIQLLGIESLQEYANRLQVDAVELDELYRDLLIGVTQFFRDPDAFDQFAKEIVPAWIARNDSSELRIWVCGCASGEEAYSLAMLLIEAFEAAGKKPHFKIFATDAHKDSLQFAATGIYPESRMKDVSPARQQRFFRPRVGGYYVAADVRRHLVFAPHNLINDPPFTQMDLVTCRNLLIYLQTSIQQRCLSLFHFSLKPGGILFLGPSESTGEIHHEFETLDKRWRLFRKRRDVRLPVDMRMSKASPTAGRGLAPPPTPAPSTARTGAVPTAIYDRLLSRMMPPSVLIDDKQSLVHSFPGSEPFLRVRSGRPTDQILDLIDPAMRKPLESSIQLAVRDNCPVRFGGLPHPTASDEVVRLIVSPERLAGNSTTYYLIQFETLPRESAADDDDSYQGHKLDADAAGRIETLEHDLDSTKHNLQVSIEALETSNEKLQASNEEMIASNEELQTTNEELHSVNEELYTVNAEHQKRVRELDEANSDMNNLLATTRVGVVFLDKDLYIRRFTPSIGELLSIGDLDIGRNIDAFVGRLDRELFLSTIRKVFQDREEREWETKCDGRWYLTRAMPYWTGAEIGGVVVSFVNIDSIKRTESELARFKYMSEESYDAQVLVDQDGIIVYANKTMAARLGYSIAELNSIPISRFDCENNFREFRTQSETLSDPSVGIFESAHRRKDGTSFPVEGSISHVDFDGQTLYFITFRDITIRRAVEAERLLLQKAIRTVENGLIICDAGKPDLPITFVNAGFTTLTGYSSDEALGKNCRFLQGPDSDPAEIHKMRQAIAEQQPCRVLLRNYRKDGTPFWNDIYLSPVQGIHGSVTHYVGVQVDVTEQIDRTAESEQRERTIRLLLDSTAEGIYGIDREGNCTFCNTACVRILGYDSADDLLGKNMHDLIHSQHADGSDFPREQCQIFQAFATSQPTTSDDEVFWTAGGDAIPVQIWSHPLVENGRCTGAVVTFIDTTQRRKQQQDLEQARRDAEAANEAKSRFLANMSHELRTPLAAILGFTRILREEPDDRDRDEKFATIERNGDYLLRLLNDVLDLSRIESGKFSTSMIPVRLDELIGDVSDTMSMRTDDYGTNLVFDLVNPLPLTITTDPARLRQILINLIGNAIKFAPRGNVNVRISARINSNDHSTRLQFVVADDGIGISADQLSILFRPFVQADPSISQRFGGTGLGLSITSRLTSALGGEIEVESDEGQGSQFTVTIPVDPIGRMVDLNSDEIGSKADNVLTDLSIANAGKLSAKVLIADDMHDVRFIAQHFLNRAGCEIQTVENGRLAVETIRAARRDGEPFDLVLMDVQMPVLDGPAAVRELREMGDDIPVIALTADAMKGTRRRLISEGFDEYLTKPLDASTLLRIATNLLLR